MKYSLRLFIFLPIVLSIAIAGILKPILERRAAFAILNRCSGVRHLHENDSDNFSFSRNFEFKLLESFLGSRFMTPYKAAVIAPGDAQGHELKSFLSNHRGLLGMEGLEIRSNKLISAKSVYPINGLTNLRVLNIQSATLDRKSINSIAKITNLEKLELNDCVFSIEDLHELTALENLAWLHINGDKGQKVGIPALRNAFPSTFITFGDFNRE